MSLVLSTRNEVREILRSNGIGGLAAVSACHTLRNGLVTCRNLADHTGNIASRQGSCDVLNLGEVLCGTKLVRGSATEI